MVALKSCSSVEFKIKKISLNFSRCFFSSSYRGLKFYVNTGLVNDKISNFFFLHFWIFSYYWLLLNSYHIIQILIARIGLKRRSVDHRCFLRKSYVLNGSDTFSHFPTEFLVFACFCCCFRSHKIYCDAFLINYAGQIPFSFHWGILECIY